MTEEVEVFIPPGSEWAVDALGWVHGKKRLHAWEVAALLVSLRLPVPAWLKDAHTIFAYCDAKPCLHDAISDGFTVRFVGTI